MQHAPAVCEVDRLADIDQASEEGAPRPACGDLWIARGPRLQHVREGRAAQALHREVRHAFVVEPDVVDRDDGRMVEATLHARLAEKPELCVGADGARAQHPLHGDLATDVEVDGGPHLAHPTASDHTAEAKARDADGREAGVIALAVQRWLVAEGYERVSAVELCH